MRMRWITIIVIGLAIVAGCTRKPAASEPAPDQTVPRPGAHEAPVGAGMPTAKNGRGTFSIGKATTYVSSPLDANGYVNFIAAVNERLSKGVTTENNAVVLIWEALGPKPVGERVPFGFFEMLGIPIPPASNRYFVSLRTYAEDNLGKDADGVSAFLEKIGTVSERPWNAKDYPDLAGWIEANKSTLAAVINATNRPHYFTPLIPGDDILGEREPLTANPFPGLQPTREIVAALSARAMLEINDGQSEQAWRDLLAIHRLARLVGAGGTLMEGLVGLAFERIASRADLVFLTTTRPDAKQLQQYQSDLVDLPQMPAMSDKVELTERFMSLDLIMLIDRYGLGYLERHSGQKETPIEIADAGLKGVDWDPALKTVNEWFDRLVDAMRQPTPAERARSFDLLEADLRSHKRQITDATTLAKKLSGLGQAQGKSQIIGDYLVATLPVIFARKVQENRDLAAQTIQNVIVAFTITRYHHDSGKYPDKLDSLTPKYLPQVPKDLFTRGALIYKPAANGYLLYSVGPNGKDDGGRGADDEPKGDDIVVRMPLPPRK